MFADPQVVTINTVAKSMPKVESKGKSAVYKMADDSFKLTISHAEQRDRVRSMVRLDYRKVVADPLTSVNDYDVFSFYFVTDRPVYGFTLADMQNLIEGLEAWSQDSGVVAKLFGTES